MLTQSETILLVTHFVVSWTSEALKAAPSFSRASLNVPPCFYSTCGTTSCIWLLKFSSFFASFHV